MPIDPVIATLIAGLGGACIGAGGAASVAAIHAHTTTQSQLKDAKAGAYSRLIATTGLLVHTAHTMRLAIQLRSGINESVDLTLRLRRPLDIFELNAAVRKDLDPLYQAWAEVWTVGTQEAIAGANELVGFATTVMGTATARGEARTGVARALLGEKWTPQQLADWNSSIEELAQCRKRFGDMARCELGHEIADLWAGRVETPR